METAPKNGIDPAVNSGFVWDGIQYDPGREAVVRSFHLEVINKMGYKWL